MGMTRGTVYLGLSITSATSSAVPHQHRLGSSRDPVAGDGLIPGADHLVVRPRVQRPVILRLLGARQVAQQRALQVARRPEFAGANGGKDSKEGWAGRHSW